MSPRTNELAFIYVRIRNAIPEYNIPNMRGKIRCSFWDASKSEIFPILFKTNTVEMGIKLEKMKHTKSIFMAFAAMGSLPNRSK